MKMKIMKMKMEMITISNNLKSIKALKYTPLLKLTTKIIKIARPQWAKGERNII
jgi:hypothetical protein